jgi:hypothetical protein
MIGGTLDRYGRLRLSNIIEIGEYAHFALLAWKTTGAARFKKAAESMLGHIQRNFDGAEGFWRPFTRDCAAIRQRTAIAQAPIHFCPSGREDMPLDTAMPEYLPPCYWTSCAFAPHQTKVVHHHPFGRIRNRSPERWSPALSSLGPFARGAP